MDECMGKDAGVLESRHPKPTEHFDVIVAGGGPSGFIAATAAARCGAKTLLIERYGFLGGMPTAAALGPISPFHFGDEQVIEGIPQEFVDRLVREEGSTGHMKCLNPYGSGSYLCFYDREVYKWAALQMVLDAGVYLLLHTLVTGPILHNGRVQGLVVNNKSGLQVYTSKVVVDATGDGDVAARAGAPFVIGRSIDGAVQPVTMLFEMADADTDRLKEYMESNRDDFDTISKCIPLRSFSVRLQQDHFVAMGFRGLIRRGLESGGVYLGQDYLDLTTTVHPGVISFNSTRVVGIHGTEAESITQGEINARRQVMSLSRFLQKCVPGFERAYLSETGVQIGVRESRHILGDYVLTEEDVLRGHKFKDVIARGCFPIDIHDVKGGAAYVQGGGTWQDLEDSYDIPYRCLVPRGLEGIVVAGRAISATHEAHGSFRTQGAVMAIGQAAGTAAALAALHGIEPRKLDVRELQHKLEENGASLHRDPLKVARDSLRAREAVERALNEGRITYRDLNRG